MNSISASAGEESLLQDFYGSTGLKIKSMFTANGRAPPENAQHVCSITSKRINPKPLLMKGKTNATYNSSSKGRTRHYG